MWLCGKEDYGRLYDGDQWPRAASWPKTNQGVRSPKGFLVLEIQERLLAFLVSCAQALLHDVPKAMLLDEKYPVQAEPAVPARDIHEWPKR